MNKLGNSDIPTPRSLPANQVNLVKADTGQDGQRLDNFLIRLLKGVPKSHVYRIVRSGEVRINGKRCAVSDRLRDGDEVRIPPIRLAVPENASQIPAAQNRPFQHPILFEDDHLIAVNKPAGVAVHGGSGVIFGVIEQIRMAREAGAYLELVHRLDRETSGILMIAKTRRALLGLHEMLREEKSDGMEKRYLALVNGRVANDRQHAKFALLKFVAPNNERRVRVDEKDGQSSHTIFNVMKRYKETTLLEAELKTGRTHQIRVHCQALGHPILGDEKYGDFEHNRKLTRLVPPLKRMFLHAARLSFLHPVTASPIRLEAPLPAELDSFLSSQVAR